MTWRSGKNKADLEYQIRRERLKSEIRQSTNSDDVTRLDPLRRQMETLTSDQPSAADLLTVQVVEAELCMFKPLSLLYPTYLRLQARMYRLEPDRQLAWEADLKRLIPNNETIHCEDVLRQRMRQLTFELNEAAESYNRLTRQKSGVLLALNFWGIGLVVALLLVEILAVYILPRVPSFRDWLLVALPAGALGAAATAIGAIRDESARREEFLNTLIAQMVVRVSLGLVYAFLVLAAVAGQIVPIKVPTEPDARIALFLALAFAAGFSDKFFGQTVSQLITKSGGSQDRADQRKTGRNATPRSRP